MKVSNVFASAIIGSALSLAVTGVSIGFIAITGGSLINVVVLVCGALAAFIGIGTLASMEDSK